jgi:response regulator RpfG family c-di-GMP phosphodiesterase
VSSPRTITLAPKTKVVCDVLVRDGALRPERVESILARVMRTGERVEEAILDLGYVAEADLLKSLAAYYKAFFISSEKLAKVDVSRLLVDMIPQRFAEQIGICPVVFDAKTYALSVVTADPDDLEALRETQLASGAREVKPVLARPTAVKALIAKAYTGDLRGFASLERQPPAQVQSMSVMYERNAIALDTGPENAAPAASAPRAPAAGRGSSSRERVVDEQDFVRTPKGGGGAPPAVQARATKVLEPPAPAIAPTPASSPDKGVSGGSFVELLHVLVSLLETSRADLRGHSAQVARLVRRMGERMQLDTGTTAMFVAAAFVHDLGKMGSLHLTPLNCSEYDGHKVLAQKAFGVPERLLEPVRLPKESTDAALHMYERYDGKGFPDGTSGKDIPLGARVLAICDTYADLTSNPRNPFRRTLSPVDACGALAKYKDTIFDPNIVDLFRSTVLGEELTARLLASRWQALVVDLDPEETTVLELRMSEQGFVVKTARSAEQALKTLAEGQTDLVISEIDLAKPDEGLRLLTDARGETFGKDLAWVVYTRRQERAIAQKAFELGVLDYVSKPASADVFVAKLKAMLEQRTNAKSPQGVNGSLREMSLPDMVQVLFHGRKSGNLRIRAREGSGEIHFVEGNVVDAAWREQRGEEAFYAMLKLADGEFALDPSFRATNRVIHQSSEALLLEGMRRMDEGLG